MNASILFLLVLMLAVLRYGETQQRGSGVWQVIEGYDLSEPRSLAFYSGENGNFSCAPVQCSAKELDRGYGYFMAATSHSNTFELLVFRVCRFLQTCIRHTHIFVTLHHTSEEVTGQAAEVFQRSSDFLQTLGVPHNSWPGQFTSNTKMVHYMESIYGLHSPDQYIFHSDLDEIVDPESLRQAIAEMDRDECDFITGVWQDRVTLDGTLSRVNLLGDMQIEEQYPLRCTYSAHFMPERTTRKVVAYRSNLRLTSGQHEVWCNIEAAPHVTWNRNGACRAHVEKRQDKSTKDNYILRLLPENLQTKPRMCKTEVVIDHYKFIAGVSKHLMERMNSYRKLGLKWWKQSLEILKDIKANEGRICTVRCPKYKCFLKELPRSYSASVPGLQHALPPPSPNHSIQKRAAISSTAIQGQNLSPELAGQIEKTVGFKVFDMDKFATGQKKHPPNYLEQDENFSQEDVKEAPLVPVAPELSGQGPDGTSGLLEGSEVAVTTLYTPKDIEERIKKLQEQLGRLDPASKAVQAEAHPAHPTAGTKRDVEALSRMTQPPRLLVFGEAIMLKMALPEMRELWIPFQKAYSAMNMAIGSERSRTLLHRIRHSDWGMLSRGKEDTGNAPLVALIAVGTNDVGKGESAQEIARMIDAIVKECIEKIPRLTNIIVLSVLPRALESFNQMIYDVNKLISDMYSDTKLLDGGVTFVDLTPLFRAKDGSIRKAMYLADRFHPSGTGYLHILKSIVPLLEEIFLSRDSSHQPPALPTKARPVMQPVPKPPPAPPPPENEDVSIRGGDAAKLAAVNIAKSIQLKKQQESVNTADVTTQLISNTEGGPSTLASSSSTGINAQATSSSLPDETHTKSYEMIDLESED